MVSKKKTAEKMFTKQKKFLGIKLSSLHLKFCIAFKHKANSTQIGPKHSTFLPIDLQMIENLQFIKIKQVALISSLHWKMNGK